jgi:hypothetical protein
MRSPEGPNLVMRPVRKGSRLSVPVFWAARDIFDGEELTINYGDGTNAADAAAAAAAAAAAEGATPFIGPSAGSAAAAKAAAAMMRVPCLCGVQSCSGFLPFDPD